jgi:hypothetical protein
MHNASDVGFDVLLRKSQLRLTETAGVQAGVHETESANEISAWSRVLLEKLVVPQLVQKFPAIMDHEIYRDVKRPPGSVSFELFVGVGLILLDAGEQLKRYNFATRNFCTCPCSEPD